MDKLLKTFSTVALATLLFILAATGISYAQNKITSDSKTYTLGAQVYDKTIYRLGSKVEIYDVVNGDVYCMGEEVIVDAIINGDLICAGNDITVAGSISGDIRLVGNQIDIEADVEQSATVLANNVTISKNSDIAGDLTLLTRSVNINGQVGRDVKIRASEVKLFAEIGRNVHSYHNTFTFDGDGHIDGDFRYSSTNRVYIPKNSVTGEVIQETIEPSSKISSSLTSTVFIVSYIYIAWFVSLLIAALGVAALFPKSLEDSVNFATKQPLITLFAGVITVLVTPILLAFLTLSLIGLPLALIIGFMFSTALLLSIPFMSHLLGSLLLPKRSHPIKALAGAVIILLVFAIPIINIFAAILTIILGVGLVVRIAAQRYGVAHRDYYKKK